MLRSLAFASILLGCAFLSAQGISDDVEVKTNEDALVTPSIGNIKVELIEPPNDPRGVHTRMNVQGYLLYNNAPVNGTVPITFSIWDAYSGGNQVWGAEVDTVSCNQGLFNFLVGGKMPINPSVFTGGTYRTLQMIISGQTMPRIVITTAPWAFSAGKSDSSAWAYNSDRVDNYHAGNSSGQIPVSNGTACTNLNADMLDGLHASSFLTTSSDYGRSGVATNLYEGTSTLTSKYVNEGQSNSITSSMITDGAVVQADIATDGVGSAEIAASAVGSSEIATGAVTTSEILDGTIQVSDCAFSPGTGDITAVNAGTGLNGGGTSGSVTLNVDVPLILSGNSSNGIMYASNAGGPGMDAYGYRRGINAIATVTSGDRAGGYFAATGYIDTWVAARLSGVDYKIYGNGNVSTLMKTRQGRKVLFAPECPEPYFEDFGLGQLSKGDCHIELDPLFLDCIKTDATHPLKVFIQLNDDCKGVYVNVGHTGFDVHELQNGTSNASFTYRVVANRKDTDYLRFPPAIEPEHAQKEEIE